MENLKQLPIAQLLQSLQSRYWSLPHRDRLALTALGGFFLVLILVYGIILPAHEYSKSADADYQKYKDEYQWFKSKESEVRALTSVKQTSRSSGKSMLSLANSSAKQRKISFKRTEPEGDNGLRVWLENVNFNDIVLWLDTLKNRYGVVAKQINIDRQDVAGKANAKIVLLRN